MKAKFLFVGILVSIFLLQGCYTPATFQSAKLVPEKKIEICPTCTINKPFSPDNPNIGFVVTRGVKPKKNTIYRYEYIGGSANLHYLGIGGKFQLIKNTLPIFGVPISTSTRTIRISLQ